MSGHQHEREREQGAESAGQLLARLGTDGQAWAREFLRRFDGEPVGGDRVDEGLMIGWFANAIETGRSAGQTVTLPA